MYKSTADVDNGTTMFEQYSCVSEENGGWLSLRKIVMARKTPRRMFVQSHTMLDGGLTNINVNCCIVLLPYSAIEATDEVKLIEFPATVAGIVESFVTRFPEYDNELEALWQAGKQ